MSPPVSAVDQLVADRYQLTARVASGGMGEVWRAQDLLLDRVVAVKTLRADLADDPDFRSRFRSEARHAAGLSHPGIATVYDFGELPDRAWLVMELVGGEPLSALLQRERTLPVERTLDLLEQTASALQAAHAKGVVHRDVKPGNLLVTPGGTVKVTDFGIASAAGTTTVTRTGQIVGTAGYLSPEQASGGPATQVSDLYALGVVAFECLAGRRPFVADTALAVLFAHLHTPPPPLPATVPPPVRALVERLLAKDPGQRPGSARELLQELHTMRAGQAEAPRTLVLPHLTDVDGPTGQIPSRDVVPRRSALPRGPHSRAVPLLVVATATGTTSRRAQRWAVRATALLLGLLAVVLGVRGQLGDMQSADRTRVPEIAAGTALSEAVATLDRADLTATQQRRTSGTTAAGQVLSVQPAPGTRVDIGTPVLLVVSTGTPAPEPTAEQQAPIDEAPALAPDLEAPQVPAPQAPVDEAPVKKPAEPEKQAEAERKAAEQARRDASKEGDKDERGGKDEP